MLDWLTSQGCSHVVIESTEEIYACLLEKWMGVDSDPIVNSSFEQLDFI